MSLLVGDEVLRARSEIVAAELAPLADGLAAELAPVLQHELYIPREKALLSRDGDARQAAKAMERGINKALESR